MTPKRLFFKVMGEDLRHRGWMAALSALSSFLFFPVVWMIKLSNLDRLVEGVGYERMSVMQDILPFCREYIATVGGAIAVLMAFTAGIAGFRFVFHRDMADAYHSMPVKRSTLFGAVYLNGILIWLLPFLVSLLLSLVLAEGYIMRGGDWELFGTMLGETALSFLVLGAVFLLVYHLVLTVVMFCGNVLNTLVCAVILGYGGIAVYGICLAFMEWCMDTFYYWNHGMREAVFVSPLCSALYLLILRGDGVQDMGTLWGNILVNLGMAAALWLCARFLYLRRSTELAEQGIRNRLLTALLRAVTALVAGMGGFMLLIQLTEGSASAIWGCFGAVLATMLAYGVLDIMFQMDFKAFFAHRGQMAAALSVTLLVCLAFAGDWFGYDSYLPDREEVAGIAVSDSGLTGHGFYGGSDSLLLRNMYLEDPQAAYAFLERAVERERQGLVPGSTWIDDGQGIHNTETVSVKVALRDGSSYYRVYAMLKEDEDVLWPLLSSREYLESAYGVDGESECLEARLIRDGNDIGIRDMEFVAELMEAYNQDVPEHPEALLLGGERLSVRLQLFMRDKNGMRSAVFLNIYEGMERSLDVFERWGYRDWIPQIKASEILAVELDQIERMGWMAGADEEWTGEALTAAAREAYGGQETVGFAESSRVYYEPEEYPTGQTGGVIERTPVVRVTDRREIEELLPLISYYGELGPCSVFRQGTAALTLVDRSGESHTGYIPLGSLPEKFILRFGEL